MPSAKSSPDSSTDPFSLPRVGAGGKQHCKASANEKILTQKIILKLSKVHALFL